MLGNWGKYGEVDVLIDFSNFSEKGTFKKQTAEKVLGLSIINNIASHPSPSSNNSSIIIPVTKNPILKPRITFLKIGKHPLLPCSPFSPTFFRNGVRAMSPQHVNSPAEPSSDCSHGPLCSLAKICWLLSNVRSAERYHTSAMANAWSSS